MKILLIIVSIVTLTASVFGQIKGSPEKLCSEGFLTHETKDFKLGSATGKKGARAYFYNDLADKCPDDESCRTKSYIVSGDKLIVSRNFRNFSCGWFAPAKGTPTVGWIRTSDLEITETLSDDSPRRWLGKWLYNDNSINFAQHRPDNFLNVTGDALYRTLKSVNIGMLDGRFEPKNGVLEYSDGDSEYDCKATMRLLGDYLVVADNLKCGGHNVSFSGVYTRKAEARTK